MKILPFAFFATVVSSVPTTTDSTDTEHGASIPGLYADPNIAVFGCNYYIYPTTDGFPGWGGQQFFVWKSSNLRHWQRSGPILTLNGTEGNVPWATGNAWAPTIIQRYGRYYLYFSGQNPTYDYKTIGVAVGQSPEGPFVAQPKAMILSEGPVNASQAIDPCAFYDPKTGKYLLYWGNGNPVLSELADDMTSLKTGASQAMSGLTDFREASFVVYRKPYYHYTYSIGDTGDADYRVGYATSENAAGPWTYRGIVLQEDTSKGILATGSNSVINVPGTDKWYMAYHHFAIPNGDGTHRQTTLDELTFGPKTGLMNEVIPTFKGPDPQLVSRKRRSWGWRHRWSEMDECRAGPWAGEGH